LTIFSYDYWIIETSYNLMDLLVMRRCYFWQTRENYLGLNELN